MTWNNKVKGIERNCDNNIEVHRKDVKTRDGMVIGTQIIHCSEEAFLELYPTEEDFKTKHKKEGHEQLYEKLKKAKKI